MTTLQQERSHMAPGEVAFDFTGRRVVITGAAGGIGRRVAELFAGAGAHLVLADLSREALESIGAELSNQGGRVLAVPYDGTDPASAEHLIAQAVQEFGGIDVLVPAAGIYPECAVANMTDQAWQQVISINLNSVFTLINRAIPHLSTGSAIVNFASVAGHRGSRLHAHYAASKAGVIALTRSLAMELGPRVRVNAVSPGTILTPMVSDLVADRGEELLVNTPLQRNGTPEEVATVVGFLASNGASYINGETLHVNGGLFMAG